MKKLVFFAVLGILIISCKEKQTPRTGETQVVLNPNTSFLDKDSIIDYVSQMDSVLFMWKSEPDTQMNINNAFIKMISENKDVIMNKILSFPEDSYVRMARSADNNLCLISWNTQMGGTNIHYATMALYKNGESVYEKHLYDSTEEVYGDTYMKYDSIFTIENKNKKIYVARGFGRGSNSLPWQELRLFTIENDKLVHPKLFPEDGERLAVEFDMTQITDDSYPLIQIKNMGAEIRYPKPTEAGGFSGKWIRYVFEQGKFVQKK